MAGIVYPERKPEKFRCETCGQEVYEIRNNACHYCGTIAYLNFRHAFNWPLDESELVALGLKQPEVKSRRKHGPKEQQAEVHALCHRSPR